MPNEADRREQDKKPDLVVGRRHSVRHPRSVEVECRGRAGTRFVARTIDLSREGALIEIRDPRFLTSPDIADLVKFTARVEEEFGDGVDVLFAGGALPMRAKVVRLASGSRRLSPMRIGCRFDEPLTEWACSKLRLEMEGDETDGAESEGAEGGDETAS